MLLLFLKIASKWIIVIFVYKKIARIYNNNNNSNNTYNYERWLLLVEVEKSRYTATATVKQRKSIRISRAKDKMTVFQTYIHDIRSYEPILPRNIDIIRQFSEQEKIEMIMELNRIVQYLLPLIDVDRDVENAPPNDKQTDK